MGNKQSSKKIDAEECPQVPENVDIIPSMKNLSIEEDSKDNADDEESLNINMLPKGYETTCELLQNGNKEFNEGNFDEALLLYMKGAEILMTGGDKHKKSNSKTKLDDIYSFTSSYIIKCNELLVKTLSYLPISNSDDDDISVAKSNPITIADGMIVMLRLLPPEIDIKLRNTLQNAIREADIIGDLVNNLGAAQFAKSSMNDALLLYRKSCEIREVVEGKVSLAVAESFQNISSCFEALGQLHEAEETLLKALQYEKDLGLESTQEYISTMNNLGVLYSHMSRDKEAEKILSNVVTNRVHELGDNHRLTLNSKNNLKRIRCKISATTDSSPESPPSSSIPTAATTILESDEEVLKSKDDMDQGEYKHMAD